MKPNSDSLIWSGEQAFRLVGTERQTDSLRIETNHKGSELPLRLVLPTLCITYADMAFANDIGGEQEPYPASKPYGPKYFDPPVELSGEAEVKKYTWIRGAHRVLISSRETEIEWYPWKTLIIPRLRLDQETPATAILAIKDVPIRVNQPLIVKVLQYADGRHIGGIRVEKRHPDWKPPDRPRDYDLWVRVIDAVKRRPIAEARLNIFHWNPERDTPIGKGGFDLSDLHFTDGDGIIQDSPRPSGELEAVTLQLPGWHSTAHCFRPLGGQLVRLFVHAWPLSETYVPYLWKPGDSLEQIAYLTGHTADRILRDNGLSDPSDLRPGINISLPCFMATYRMEPGNTFKWLVEVFGYESVEELAMLNGVRDIATWDGRADIALPDWTFLYARRDEYLPLVDEMFHLPKGSTRVVGRVYHPHAWLPYEGETIAVPNRSRAEALNPVL